MTDHMPDEIVIRLEWGKLAVPKFLMKIWATSGWPADDVLERMVKAGSVEAAVTVKRPPRPTLRVSYMVAMDNVRSGKVEEACRILDRMTQAELVLFGEEIDRLRSLIIERIRPSVDGFCGKAIVTKVHPYGCGLLPDHDGKCQ